MSRPAKLSPAQREMLTLLAQGYVLKARNLVRAWLLQPDGTHLRGVHYGSFTGLWQRHLIEHSHREVCDRRYIEDYFQLTDAGRLALAAAQGEEHGATTVPPLPS